MPLNWGSEKCKTPLPKDETEAAWRNIIVWGSLPLCLSRITEDNIEEWLWRAHFMYRISDLHEAPMCIRTGPSISEEHLVTKEILERWVGLWTNAPYLPRKTWVKERMAIVDHEVNKLVRNAMKGE